MRYKTNHCPRCNDETKHGVLGFIPSNIPEEGSSNRTWVKAEVCSGCGSMTVKSIDDEEYNKAVRRVREFYKEHDLD